MVKSRIQPKPLFYSTSRLCREFHEECIDQSS